MLVKIVDMNKTDVFLNFNDGMTLDICKSHIPKNIALRDKVSMDLSCNTKPDNDKMSDFFI